MSRRGLRLSACFLTISLACLCLPAQTPASDEQESYIGCWTTEAGWSSDLHLKNNFTKPLMITPKVRYADGVEVALPSVLVKPKEVKHLDMESAMSSTGISPSARFGSLALEYSSEHVRNVYAAQEVGHSLASIPFRGSR
jgi:hypothetical protein